MELLIELPPPSHHFKKRYHMESLKVEKATFDAIAKEIHSDSSPVGIDAKKTHIIILEKLLQLEERLKRIEGQLSQNSQ